MTSTQKKRTFGLMIAVRSPFCPECRQRPHQFHKRIQPVPKLKPETREARRDHILDVAASCFARNGYHATSMHMICREADVSAGALYTYFDSKEALIAGICERDRAEFSDRFEAVATERELGDVMGQLDNVAQHYFVEAPHEKLAMMVEIGAEAMRNQSVRDVFLACDQNIEECFVSLFDRLKAEGRIAPDVATKELASLLQIIGDGLLWRRATHPEFDGAKMLPAVLALVGSLIGPSGHGETASEHVERDAADANPPEAGGREP